MLLRRFFELIGIYAAEPQPKAARGPVLLSKSKYLIGLQCPKALWISYNNKKVIPAIDARTSAIFEQGHEVGTWAKRLFTNGLDLGQLEGFDEPVRATQAALATNRALFEAAFVFERCFSRADILEPVGNGFWDIIEVKSSTGVKPVYLGDLAFQRYVYEGTGLRIRRCYLLHINNRYVRNGIVDPVALFSKIDVTQAVAELMATVEPKVREMFHVIDSVSCPEVKISTHCNTPYECSLKVVCWKFLPNPSVFDLRRAGKKACELLNQTVMKIDEIPTDFSLNELQSRQVASHRSGTPHVDAVAICAFLRRLVYPLYFLDFETVQPAIPFYDRSRPYGQIPFQFSLHKVEFEGALPAHFEFLVEGCADPRPDLLCQLANLLENSGSIIGYNVDFEVACLKECVSVFPQYQDWFESLLPRFVDLYDLFDDFSYYHPSQNGSASLKAVLPALTGVDYGELEIGSGDFAQREFVRITFGQVMSTERARVRAALRAYCGRDTGGLIDMLRALEKLVAGPIR
jgi:hypothetical protein